MTPRLTSAPKPNCDRVSQIIPDGFRVFAFGGQADTSVILQHLGCRGLHRRMGRRHLYQYILTVLFLIVLNSFYDWLGIILIDQGGTVG